MALIILIFFSFGVFGGEEQEYDFCYEKKAVTWAGHLNFCRILIEEEILSLKRSQNVYSWICLGLWGINKTGQLGKIKKIAVLFGKLGGPVNKLPFLHRKLPFPSNNCRSSGSIRRQKGTKLKLRFGEYS
ncbi:hypothetical protein BpHYR1_003134 [Brachionus plicatilis]|uniref:Uncharacterized protein n=1 Tax=Brachionus plicatilis TaxID=10195 RepID=A0A3M7QBG8_BRAPC|nr:hypothetical protein BpHYR1_003134 [Brachionus plicatilis]